MPINVNYQPGAGAVGQVALDAGRGFYQQYLDQQRLREQQQALAEQELAERVRIQEQELAQRDRMQERGIVADARSQKLGLAVGQQNLVYETQNTNQRQINDLYTRRFMQMADIAAQQQSQAFSAQQRQQELAYTTNASIYQQLLGQYGRERLTGIDFQNNLELQDARLAGQLSNSQALQQSGYGYDQKLLQQRGQQAQDNYQFQQTTQRDFARNEQDYQEQRRIDQLRTQAEAVKNSDILRDTEKDYIGRHLEMEALTGGSLPGVFKPEKDPYPAKPYTPEGAEQPIMGADGKPVLFQTGPDGMLRPIYDGSDNAIKLQREQNTATDLQQKNEILKEEFTRERERVQWERENEAWKTYSDLLEKSPADAETFKQRHLGISTGSTVQQPTTSGKGANLAGRGTPVDISGMTNGQTFVQGGQRFIVVERSNGQKEAVDQAAYNEYMAGRLQPK